MGRSMNIDFQTFIEQQLSVGVLLSSLFSLGIALALIVVGFVMVKKIHSASGLVIGVAGVLTLLMNCCCRVFDAAMYSSELSQSEVARTVWTALSMTVHRIPTVMTIVGVAMLANHIAKAPKSDLGDTPETL